MVSWLKIPAWAAAPAAGLAMAAGLAGVVLWRASNADIRAAATSAVASAASAALPAETLPVKPLPAISLPDASVPAAPAAAIPSVVALQKADAPAFDIVRVEPGGDAVVAGRGTAGASIALVDAGGKVLAQGKIDTGGQFVLLPEALQPGDHLLSLRMAAAGARPVDSQQNVAVSVADQRHGGVLVALAEPGKPTVILSDNVSTPPVKVATPQVPAALAAAPSPAASTDRQPLAPVPAAIEPPQANPGAPVAAQPAAPVLPAIAPPQAKPVASVAAQPLAPVPLAVAPPQANPVAPVEALAVARALPAPDDNPALSLQPRVDAAVAASPAVPTIAIRTVEVEAGGGFFATGQATIGAAVRLYLNGSSVAALKANAIGHWSLKIAKGMRPGHYAVRADQLAANLGSVVARAEVPFDYPANTGRFLAKKLFASKLAPSAAVSAKPAVDPGAGNKAVAPNSGAAQDLPSLRAVTEQPPPAGTVGTNPPDAANIVVRELQTATVQRGDSLWRISRKSLGKGIRYTQIYEANTKQIRNPSLIYVGQVLVMPVAAP